MMIGIANCSILSVNQYINDPKTDMRFNDFSSNGRSVENLQSIDRYGKN